MVVAALHLRHAPAEADGLGDSVRHQVSEGLGFKAAPRDQGRGSKVWV